MYLLFTVVVIVVRDCCLSRLYQLIPTGVVYCTVYCVINPNKGCEEKKRKEKKRGKKKNRKEKKRKEEKKEKRKENR